MKCVICKQGETAPGFATLTLERQGATVVVRGVPAQVCRNCGEEYIDGAEALRLAELADRVGKAGIRYEVRDYMAA
jgi:YgiT-type zinc finger domain-containing protein